MYGNMGQRAVIESGIVFNKKATLAHNSKLSEPCCPCTSRFCLFRCSVHTAKSTKEFQIRKGIKAMDYPTPHPILP